MKKVIYYLLINNFMNEKYNVYLVSDSTGETLDRILSLKSQFENFDYEKKEFALLEQNNKLAKLSRNVMMQKTH